MHLKRRKRYPSKSTTACKTQINLALITGSVDGLVSNFHYIYIYLKSTLPTFLLDRLTPSSCNYLWKLSALSPRWVARPTRLLYIRILCVKYPHVNVYFTMTVSANCVPDPVSQTVWVRFSDLVKTGEAELTKARSSLALLCENILYQICLKVSKLLKKSYTFRPRKFRQSTARYDTKRFLTGGQKGK